MTRWWPLVLLVAACPAAPPVPPHVTGYPEQDEPYLIRDAKIQWDPPPVPPASSVEIMRYPVPPDVPEKPAVPECVAPEPDPAPKEVIYYQQQPWWR